MNLDDLIRQILLEEKTKRDRCLRIADRKFDKPSAYKSGAVVRCRQGKIWKGLKEIERTTSLVGGNIDYNQFIDWAKGEADKVNPKKTTQSGLEFQWAEDSNGVKVIVYEKNIPLGYVGLEKFEDGYKINTLGVKDIARGKGLAIKMYDYIISKVKLYSDKMQTPEARKLWTKLATKYKLQGYNKKDKQTFDVTPENDELKSTNPKYELYSDKKNDNYLVIKEIILEIPQSGESSGKPAQFKSGTEPEKIENLTLDQILQQVKGIPYYKEVLDDMKNKDESWGVTKKVKEYAEYMKKNPSSLKNLPPIIVVDDKIQDGAHRISAIYLLQNLLDSKNDFWKKLKLKVEFWDSKNLETGYSELREIIKKIIQEDESLHKWFKRQGPSGKEGGWVDCNTCRKVDGKTKCKSCGRKKGEKRSKYPSCRPTPAQCKQPGKGKKWGKTK